MNCKQLNAISLEEVLATLGHLPTKQTEKEAWYFSPFGTESQASFKIDKPKNIWYLFSEGVGGTTTDFMQKYLNTGIKGALEWGAKQNFSSFHEQIKAPKPPPNYHIDRIMDIAHPNLIAYLNQRGLSEKIYPFIKELWFTIEKKQLYAVGFKNNSDGWELRNAFYKGALNKKDIMLLSYPENPENNPKVNILVSVETPKIETPCSSIAVFEGFIDALSFIEMQKRFKGDLLVLNSTALLSRGIEELAHYHQISLFLDNDKAGRKCTAKIMDVLPHAKDFAYIYSHHKDLNGYLIEKRQQQVLSAPTSEAIPKRENGSTEKQEPCKKETDRIKKGMRRKM